MNKFFSTPPPSIEGKKIIIHNAKHKRTFCNIEFAIDLIFNISHKKKLTNKTFNIGSPEKEISIMELAQKIKLDNAMLN